MQLIRSEVKDGIYTVLDSGTILTDMNSTKIISNIIKQNNKDFEFSIEIKIKEYKITQGNNIITRSASTNSDLKNAISLEFVNTVDYSFTDYPVELFDINGEKIYIRASLQVLNKKSGIFRYTLLSY